MMLESPTILVVEDGPAEREALARVLRLEKYDVLTAGNPDEALKHLNQPIDLVLSDLRMGKTNGLDLLRYWKERRPHTPFIMVTAYGDVESAVAAMKLGAKDYLTKPVNPDALLELIRRCLAQTAACDRELAVTGAKPAALRGVIAASAGMLKVCEQTHRVAPTESTVLILGESGTGKELIAQAIHENSPRCWGPFIVVNMAAIPETLVESELFGHVMGAFTGAVADRAGCFERAHGGTIFIDEIGDFPGSSQAKLLRVLENRTVTRVGGNDDTTVNVRVVAATSRNLPQMVSTGAFREDLYYRLNVVAIHIPPLRERRDDIGVLAEHFLQGLCCANHRSPRTLDPPLLRYLESFDWPGNVRQLRNCVENMVVMAPNPVLTLNDLPRSICDPAILEEAAGPADQTLDDLQKTAILRTLREHGGNRTHTAEALGISVRTLQRRLKDWGLQDDSSEA
jgi:DNA-binding NtrC family response regulator